MNQILNIPMTEMNGKNFHHDCAIKLKSFV